MKKMMIVALLLATSCVPYEPEAQSSRCVSQRGYEFCQVRFPDGQRCVVGAGNGTSISCDWVPR